MSRFRTVIVEDEPLARGIVRDLLARDRRVEVVGEADDGRRGLELIERLRPDLAFLDVEMPGLNGVEIIKTLDPKLRPEVVYITAYSEFATEAFEVEALDYVVKPFSDERFFRALERAKGRIKEHRMSRLLERAASEAGASDAATASDDSQGNYLSAIPVKAGGRSLLIRMEDLLWIESADYYARLHTRRGSHLVRLSLSRLDQRLDPSRFLRVHRGAIVNVREVVAVEHLPKGAQRVVLSDGTRCAVSRARKRAVEAVLLPGLD